MDLRGWDDLDHFIQYSDASPSSVSRKLVEKVNISHICQRIYVVTFAMPPFPLEPSHLLSLYIQPSESVTSSSGLARGTISPGPSIMVPLSAKSASSSSL